MFVYSKFTCEIVFDRINWFNVFSSQFSEYKSKSNDSRPTGSKYIYFLSFYTFANFIFV